MISPYANYVKTTTYQGIDRRREPREEPLVHATPPPRPHPQLDAWHAYCSVMRMPINLFVEQLMAQAASTGRASHMTAGAIELAAVAARDVALSRLPLSFTGSENCELLHSGGGSNALNVAFAAHPEDLHFMQEAFDARLYL